MLGFLICHKTVPGHVAFWAYSSSGLMISTFSGWSFSLISWFEALSGGLFSHTFRAVVRSRKTTEMEQTRFERTAQAVLMVLWFQGRFCIKKSIQLQRDFQFCRPFRAVWLAECAFCQPSRAVWPVDHGNVIQLQWDFRFCQPSGAKCLFLRSEFHWFSSKMLKIMVFELWSFVQKCWKIRVQAETALKAPSPPT